MEICVAKGGSITGEHGVGIEKRRLHAADVHAGRAGRDARGQGGFRSPRHPEPGQDFPGCSPSAADRRPHPAARTPTGVPAVLRAGHEPRRLRKRPGFGARGKIGPGRGRRHEVRWLRSRRRDPAHRPPVRDHDYALEDLYVTVGAGTRLRDLQAELARDKMWVPLVRPGPPQRSAASSPPTSTRRLRMRYGSIRDLVLAASVVLPDGRSIRAGRPVVKNVAGYDLTKLFVGAGARSGC